MASFVVLHPMSTIFLCCFYQVASYFCHLIHFVFFQMVHFYEKRNDKHNINFKGLHHCHCIETRVHLAYVEFLRTTQ